MAARFQFAVLKLSEQAQVLIHRLLDSRKGPVLISRSVHKQTGEKISPSCILRYAQYYRMRKRIMQKGRKRTDELVELAAQNGDQIPEMLRAAFLESFTEASMNGAVRDMNPLTLETAERKRQELKIKERQMLLAERRVEVVEQRLQFDRDRRSAELKRLDEKAHKGQPLTPEDVRRIREIYGLADERAAEEQE